MHIAMMQNSFPMRGVPVRHLDHLNLIAQAVTPSSDLLLEQLCFRLRENTILNNGAEAGACLSVSALVHELAVMGDRAGSIGRLRHIYDWYGYPQHVSDIADVLVENGIQTAVS